MSGNGNNKKKVRLEMSLPNGEAEPLISWGGDRCSAIFKRHTVQTANLQTGSLVIIRDKDNKVAGFPMVIEAIHGREEGSHRIIHARLEQQEKNVESIPYEVRRPDIGDTIN